MTVKERFIAAFIESDRWKLYISGLGITLEIALFAGSDGMDAYRNILPNAPKYLNSEGSLLLEIGYDQAEKIKQIPSELKLARMEKDLAGIRRACIFRFF